MKPMGLAQYTPEQAQEIKTLFTTVFTNSEGQSEGTLIGNLAWELMTETDKNDLYGFVALEKERVIGAIFFSRLIFESDICAFILSPVAIASVHQGKGVGQRLINYGIQALKETGVELIMTYGDPDYYSRVGFHPVAEETIKAPLRLTHPEGWQGQSLTLDPLTPIAGQSLCVRALNKPEYW